jgi:hypothetical protein
MAVPSILIRMFGLKMAKQLVSLDSSLSKKVAVAGAAGMLAGIDCDSKAHALALTLVDYVKDGIIKKQFRLAANSPFTRLVFGKRGPPMYDTGELLSHIQVQKAGNCTYRVYWDTKPLRNHEANANPRGNKKGAWNARTLIAFNRPNRPIRRPATKKQSQMFKILAEKYLQKQKGMKKAARWDLLLQHGVGRKNYITTRRRGFWDIAVRKFISRHGTLPGVDISKDDYSVTIRIK